MSTNTIKQQREMLFMTALSYGAGVWLLLQAGREDEAADCAYRAWASDQAARAENPWERWMALHQERFGPEWSPPPLRLVVHNTSRMEQEVGS